MIENNETTTETPVVDVDAIVTEITSDVNVVSENKGSNGDAPATETNDEPKETSVEAEDSSPGIVNLRNHVKELEDDINNVYKPANELVEEYGGIEGVKEALSLYDPLTISDEVESSKQFLDNLWTLTGGTKYSAIIEQIFQDHGEQYLAKLGLNKSQVEAPSYEFEKDLDPEDPVQKALNEMREQIAKLQANNSSPTPVIDKKELEQQAQERANKYIVDRYAPVEKATAALDFGEDSEFYREAVKSTVEKLFEKDEESVKKFIEAGNMVRKGEEKLARRLIGEVDKKIAELTQLAIDKFSSKLKTASTEVKQKLENNDLPKAEALPAEPARTTVAAAAPSGKAFDPNEMTAKLRLLESQGRFGNK